MHRAVQRHVVAAAWLTLAGFVPLADAATRVAILASESAGAKDLAALVENSLEGRKDIALVERAAIDRVLQEQRLQTLLAPGDAARRAATGRVLKADLLVTVREHRKPRPHFETAVCETRQGLRLGVQRFASAPSQIVARSVAEMLQHALAKLQAKITAVIAVPPLIDESVSLDGNHLMPAYARLIEQVLAEQPGTAVVEIEEARAVGRELVLAGEAAPGIQPLFLAGRYRVEARGGKRGLVLDLAIERGGQPLGTWHGADLAPDEAPVELCRAALALLAKAGSAARLPGNADAAARQLEAQGKAHLTVGYCREALALFEASLLLRPRQSELHGQALMASSLLIENALLEQGTDADALRQLIALRRRQLSHVEAYALGSELGFGTDAEMLSWQRFHHFNARLRDLEARWPGRRFPPVVAEAWQTCREEEEAMIQRVLRVKAAAETRDAAVFCLGMHAPSAASAVDARRVPRYQAICDRQREVCHRFAYLEGTMSRPQAWKRVFPTPRFPAEDAEEWRTYLAFLKDVRTLPNAEIRSVAGGEIARAEAVLAGSLYRDQPPNRTAAVRSGDVAGSEVVVRPIDIVVIEAGGRETRLDAPASQWLPAGTYGDLLVSRGRLLLMRHRGRAEPIAEDISLRHAGLDFDGRYVWAGTRCDDEPLLAAIDPAAGSTTRFSPADGLPTTGSITAVVGLAPGRACVIGNAGGPGGGRRNENRAWIAVAELLPSGTKTFHVFHVARRIPDTAGNAVHEADVSCEYRTVGRIAVPLAGSDEQRILIGRGFGGQQRIPPLLVDPQRWSVEALPFALDPRNTGAIRGEEGSWFWLDDLVPPQNAEATLYRFGAPEFRPVAVRAGVPARGQVFFDAGRWFVRGQESGRACWRMSDSADGPFRRLAVSGAEPPQCRPLCHSNFYGLVELTDPPLEVALPR